LLIAQWGSWCVRVYTPDGKPDGEIKVDAPQVSCCAFGGADLKTLYITTASVGLSLQKMKDAPLAGQLFAIRMDIPGLPEPRYKG
jgi:sugar lactone lactonase YvrE